MKTFSKYIYIHVFFPHTGKNIVIVGHLPVATDVVDTD